MGISDIIRREIRRKTILGSMAGSLFILIVFLVSTTFFPNQGVFVEAFEGEEPLFTIENLFETKFANYTPHKVLLPSENVKSQSFAYPQIDSG